MFSYSLSLKVLCEERLKQRNQFFQGRVDLDSEVELDIEDVAETAMRATEEVLSRNYVPSTEMKSVNPMARMISSLAHAPHERRRDRGIRDAQNKWLYIDSGTGPRMLMMDDLDGAVIAQVKHYPHSLVRNGNISADTYPEAVRGKTFRVFKKIDWNLMDMVKHRLEFRGSSMSVPEDIVRCSIVDTIGMIEEAVVVKKHEGS